jgi:hypothetical protein
LSQPFDGWEVRSISSAEAEPWIKKRHYLHRMPNITHCFGLLEKLELRGLASFGMPASRTLCSGVCGPDWQDRVLELNRMVVEDSCPKNSGTFLLSRAMALIEKPRIIVSYADPSAGHFGLVYQAFGFLYTGLSSPHLDHMVDGGKKHPRHSGEYEASRVQDGQRVRKHRYVFLNGTGLQKKAMRKALRYKPEPKPEGEIKRYDASEAIVKSGRLF